ncbi:MAG: hypothetical protein ACE5O2_10455 [Armatimonadota bacterium]
MRWAGEMTPAGVKDSWERLGAWFATQGWQELAEGIMTSYGYVAERRVDWLRQEMRNAYDLIVLLVLTRIAHRTGSDAANASCRSDLARIKADISRLACAADGLDAQVTALQSWWDLAMRRMRARAYL